MDRGRYLIVDVRGRVYVADSPQTHVGTVLVRQVIDMHSRNEVYNGEEFPIREAPPSEVVAA